MYTDDEGAMHAKARHVLRKLRAGEIQYRNGLNWFCPFCNQRLATDRNSVQQHAAGRASLASKKPGSYKAKHAAFSFFLQELP